MASSVREVGIDSCGLADPSLLHSALGAQWSLHSCMETPTRLVGCDDVREVLFTAIPGTREAFHISQSFILYNNEKHAFVS